MFSSCYCLSSSRSTSGWVASAPLEPPCVRFPRLSRASSTHGVARPPSREEAREEDRLNHGRPRYPVVIVSQGLGVSLGIAAWVVFLFILVFLGFFLRWVVQNLSFQRNERHLLAFALRLLIPIVGLGFISQFPIELVLIADLALALLFANLR